jgi:hypothetical protein
MIFTLNTAPCGLRERMTTGMSTGKLRFRATLPE